MYRKVSIKDARKRISYEPETGDFIWLKHRIKKQIGRVAGTRQSKGYLNINILGTTVLAHRLAWALHNDSWPDCEIDHINGVRDDNRINNLRAVNRSENMKNKSAYRDGAITGIHKRSNGKYRARIRVNGMQHNLGTFSDLSEAVDARYKAERKFGFHRNHGRTSS